ncbi:peptide chain release factor H [Pragia fontium]|uniref:Peptide chain release factor n=2 Tax=Pragia fontium TaxID=82985 RepID=A0AAJ5BGC9_9GAMM|nr:peptide chain release factor H [Pragia fontium]GKX62133.1 peptide chain release factor H [Pragia fontium]SFC37289.1 peptide chain release factor [Pragia fontium DSM 5563 = ATCC 49100]SUB82068.1 Peptide chain release factor 2 [Pragia fontium]VEJ54695.1 Peptide chain release factor 2 [Pragia fontium]
MILLQFSSAQGPDECCLAVSKALKQLIKEANLLGIEVNCLESEPARLPDGLRSALVSLNGHGAEALAERWCGSLLWVCSSPYRPNYKRKNWFIGIARFSQPDPELESKIHFESLRSSGPGGQHVNKTDSAIRATHVATGISVKVQSERSQHANKRLAILLISHRLDQLKQQADAELKSERRMFHHQIERGNPQLIFKDIGFKMI